MGRIAYVRIIALTLCVAGCAANSSVSVSGRPSAELTGAHVTRIDEVPEVEWVLAPDPTERALLDDWWQAVGKPVFHVQQSQQGQQADSLVLITWNLHSGGGDLPALIDDLQKGVLTGQPVSHFVLLLQEAFHVSDDVPLFDNHATPRRIEAMPPQGPRRDIVDVAQALDLSMIYVPSMRNGAAGSGSTEEDRGSAILSTLPLHDYTAIELPFESQRRVSIAATVRGISTRGTVWNLRVCSAHLDPRSRWSRFFSSFGSGRLRQARFLIEAMPETPAVIAGDLNTWSFKFMETSLTFFRKHFPSTPSHEGKSFTIPLWNDRRLNHMYFRLPDACFARYVLINNKYGSDHRPLLGWITCQIGD